MHQIIEAAAILAPNGPKRKRYANRLEFKHKNQLHKYEELINMTFKSLT